MRNFAILALAMILLSFTGSLAQAAPPKGVVILIPGTCNSVLPGYLRFTPAEGIIEANPYFSIDAVSSIEAQGFITHVVNGLHPFGQFEGNGEIAIRDMTAWYLARYPHGEMPITILAHSAGGFQALYVAAHRTDLPIQRIVLISTPLAGVELAQKIHDQPWIGEKIASFADSTRGFFELRSIPELTAENTAHFLQSIRIPSSVHLYTVGGDQGPPPNALHEFDARYLPIAFQFTNSIIGSRSDGIVSFNSVYGVGSVGVRDLQGQRMTITPLRALQMPLNHAEQILDYRLFKYTGTLGSEFIRDEQRKFYSAVVRDLP
jgi:hypothetical protein